MFLWCHFRHLNPVRMHPERITRKDKILANNFNYDGVEFPVRENCFSKIETKNSISINAYYHGNKLTFPVYVSDQQFENSINLL